MEAKNGYQLVSPIVDSLINQFCTFYIVPDGSKEGYDASEDGDIIRRMIIDLISQQKDENGENPFKFIEVCYGADDGSASILHHN